MKNSHIKINKGLEVETMHGLETLDTLWSCFFFFFPRKFLKDWD